MYTINPYIRFNNKCREALTLYSEIIGGRATFQTVGEAPESAQMKGVSKDTIMHATVTNKDGSVFMLGSDLTTKEGHKYGNTTVLLLNCETEEDLRTAFDRLAQGGTVTAPVQATFWGAIYAQVTDAYGVLWMLNHDKNPKK